MASTVVIDCFPERAALHAAADAIVAVDVFRMTTTAATALAQGRRCFPAPSVEAARLLAASVPGSLLVGELHGMVPPGFDLGNSPALLSLRGDDRPVVLTSTSGARLVCGAAPRQKVYAVCLRNLAAHVAHLAGVAGSVAVIGAGSGGQFRDEDALCCALIADGLMAAGASSADAATADIVNRWRDVPLHHLGSGPSADFLRRAGRQDDVDFVLGHVDDLDQVIALRDGELVLWPAVLPRP